MKLTERAELYRKAFPKFQPLSVVQTADGGERLEGLWIMGQNYTVKSGYYGGYPHGYLPRVLSMFPEVLPCDTLHLFSGQVKSVGALTFDINPARKPAICGDAEKLSEYFVLRSEFQLILADPPYSQEDADHYGTPMVSRTRVLKECFKVLRPGGFLVWLDQVFPMFSKEMFHLAGAIGMIKSTNHRVRAVFIFQKTDSSSPLS